jgi:hypothetical protein
MYIMAKIKSRKNNLRGKLSRKSKILSGGGENGTTISIFKNPTKENSLAKEGAFACMLFETKLNKNIMDGGAQLRTSNSTNRFFPHETITQILQQKLNSEQNIDSCISFIHNTGILQGVDSADVGLAGPPRRINIAVTVTRRLNDDLIFHFTEMHGFRLIPHTIGTDPHATQHPVPRNDGGPEQYNRGKGTLHIYGQVPDSVQNIQWFLYVQSECDNVNLSRAPGRLHREYSFQEQINANAAIANAAQLINPKFFIYAPRFTVINRDTGDEFPAPDPFYQRFLDSLRDYLLDGIDINQPAYRNLDIAVKIKLSETIENICADINFDRRFTPRDICDQINGIENRPMYHVIGSQYNQRNMVQYPHPPDRNQRNRDHLEIRSINNPRCWYSQGTPNCNIGEFDETDKIVRSSRTTAF